MARKRTIYRDGQEVPAHRDRQARRAQRDAKKKLDREQKAKNTRDKYGPSMKPAPVTIKTIAPEHDLPE
jgi:hypothetical protein